jgi:signal transduction histidine kinase
MNHVPGSDSTCTLSGWRNMLTRGAAEPSWHDEAESLRALAYEVTVAEARERERIAQGLHDDIGQSLALVALKLGELSLSVGSEAAVALVHEVRALVLDAARATRSVTFDLNCPVLQQLGLQVAIESLAQRMGRLYGLQVHAQVEVARDWIAPALHPVVFRVVRELLFNVQKHASARHAWVRSNRLGGQLSFRVWDDGVGFAPERRARRFGPEGGFGLFSARAQIRAIGGGLEIDSAPGRGTCATVTVPLIAS